MANSFFGVQLAFDLPADDDLRRMLTTLVADNRAATTMIAQRTCWTRASSMFAAALPSAKLATWDLLHSGADHEFEEWSSGLEAMADWPAADFGENGTCVLASMFFLVTGGSNADRTLGDACDIPERDWHRRTTYRHLVAIPPTLNLTGVLASGLYLAPRPDQRGFSLDVLSGEGFEYLDGVRD